MIEMNNSKMKEYQLMYQKVLNSTRFSFMSKDEIIEYLVIQRYYYSELNALLKEKMEKINELLSQNDNSESYYEEDLPF